MEKDYTYNRARDLFYNKGLLLKDDEYDLLDRLLDFHISFQEDSLYAGRYEEQMKAQNLKFKIKHYKRNLK